MNICTTSLCTAALLALGAEAATCIAVNVNGGKASALRQGAESAGLDLEFTSEADFARLPDVLVWQASAKGSTLSPDDIAKLERHLAKGAALLLTTGREPGLDAFRLAPLLPTTAWQTLMPANGTGEAAPAVKSCDADERFFGGNAELLVPFRFRMRPIDAAELGETRLEGIGRKMPLIGEEIAADTPFVSRPLMNRDWRTRLYAACEEHDSLLITGRYGAGRVAVFASSAEVGTEEFWKAVFAFLSAKTALSKMPSVSDIAISADPRTWEIRVTASNKSKADTRLPVVARVFSWNGEYVCDVSSTFAFAAGKKGTARLKIPDGGKFRPQSMDFRRSCTVKVEAFSPDGSKRLADGKFTLASARPVSVDLVPPRACSGEELLPGPTPSSLLGLDDEASKELCEYCFRPGETRKFTVVARNGGAKDVKLDFDVVVRPFNAGESALPDRLEDLVPAGGEIKRDIDVTMPKLNGGEKFGAGRIEVTYKGKTVSYVPYIVTPGEAGSFLPNPAESLSDSTPVTLVHDGSGGLRHWVPDGAGSAAGTDGEGSTPEDEVFAYSRRINGTRISDAPDPTRLFLAERGFTEDCNPWAHVPCGDRFMAAAKEGFMGALPPWKLPEQADGSSAVIDALEYEFLGSWGCGPSVNMMFSWQEIVEFDRHLRATGKRGLMGRTLRELREEIEQTQMHQFLKWQFDSYQANMRQLRDQMKSVGKKSCVTVRDGSGIPLLPPDAVQEFADMLGEMSSDARLECRNEDLVLAPAREMVLKAFNPGWRLRCRLAWGRDNSVYSDRGGRYATGVTETSRRHSVTKAWRSVIGNDGRFASIYSSGFTGLEAESPVRDGNDIQQNWLMAQRIARIRPDGPIGMGLCVGAGVLSDENSFVFSGAGAGGCDMADALLRRSFGIIGEMHRRRVGVSFAANATALSNTGPSLHEPLLVPLPDTFSADERAFVATWAKSRGKILLITDGKAIAPEFAELFGDAQPQQGSDVVSLSKYGVVIDRELEKITQEDFDIAAGLVRENFNLGTVFPDGVSGYGFTAGRRRFVAVEDLREEGRDVTVKVRAGYGKTASAMEFNEHRSLDVVRDGAYWSVTLPLKKADGNLVMFEEK